ncbi:SEL1-like repeat protein [Ramlibacter sp. XY19]|uniref:SEL1-like repeat protein n=1 Tax=Ramlibacter paludis TaxID=2908000 RepID=UPI0023DC4108|nr:SEL1-like repeat protein [Ramlibacter paludis]MCG2593869.1 SEL1-like repeat protein [Ramlibacter paludis]
MRMTFLSARRYALVATAVAVLAACASRQDLREGSGRMGGFTDELIQPGLYAIRAVGNLPFISAHTTWERRANQLCGKGQHVPIELGGRRQANAPFVAYVQRGTVLSLPTATEYVEGYVLCKASPLQPAEAVRYVEALPALRQQQLTARLESDLEALGGGDCDTPPARDAAETFYRRGKVLLALARYGQAHGCLMKSVATGPSAATYVDACAALGEMHERGWGVPADREAARQWFVRAGLL